MSRLTKTFGSARRRARRGVLTALAACALVAPLAGLDQPGLAAAATPDEPRVAFRPVRTLRTADAPERVDAVVHVPAIGGFLALRVAGDEVVVTALDGRGDRGGRAVLPLRLTHAWNATFDPRSSRLLIYDDVAGQLVTVDYRDGSLDVASLTRRRLAIGPIRAAGIAMDPATGALHVLDRLASRIAVVPESTWSGAGAERAAWVDLGLAGRPELRGLAWDGARREWNVWDAASSRLLAFDEHGAPAGSWETPTAMPAVRALAIAPTGDGTDAPERTSVYVARADDSPGAGIVELKFRGPGPLTTSATVATTLVRTINTYQWSPPSPDPSGVGYDPVQNRLIVVDGEVDEMSIYRNANIYECSLTGTLLRSSHSRRFSDEPVGVSYDRVHARRVYVSDDDQRHVFVMDVGADGHLGGSDDTWTSFDTRDFNCQDPEGVTYDYLNDRLYIAAGLDEEIFQIRPGSDGRFGTSDDVISHFDTSVLGVQDPETCEFHPGRGSLFIIGTNHDIMIEASVTGALLNTLTVSAPLKKPAGMALAPHSSNSSQLSLYVSDRAVDNDSNSSENDGKIFELTASLLGPNSGDGGTPPPPSGANDFPVTAGSDDAEQGGSSGSVTVNSGDLEMVLDGSTVQTVGLRFTDVTVPKNAAITAAWIQFTADESQSETTTLTIRGQAADNPPTFTSSSNNISSRPPTSASVTWSPGAWSTSDGAGTNQQTSSLVPIVQELVNRSGWASGQAMAFIITGSGHRTAVAQEAGAPPVLHIEIELPNHAPGVNAGSNQTITLGETAALNGTVSDDGKPGPYSVTWTKSSGPGSVGFANNHAVDTDATFSVDGTYVLRLTADDGDLTAFDEVQIVVDPSSSPPPSGAFERTISAGSDDAEQKGTSVTLNSDLELVADGSSAQTVGLRFTNVTIPKNTTIANAWIQFTADEAQSGTIPLVIEGQAADNPTTFTTGSSNISSRPRTAASVNWSPDAWVVADGAGPKQRTANLKSIVQQLVNRSGWASGNAMAFIISSTTTSSHRTAYAYEGSSTKAAVLIIETGDTGNPAPSVDAGPSRTVTFPGPASLDGTVTDDGPFSVTWSMVSGPPGGSVIFTNSHAVDTDATFTAAGTYQLRLEADDGSQTASDQMQVTVNPVGGGSGTVVERRIDARNDDAEELAGSMGLSSSDLELVDDAGIQRIGLRFRNLAIPQGATITAAWIQFTADESQSEPTSLTLKAQAIDDAPTFSSSAKITGRTLGSASVSWPSLEAWLKTDGPGPKQKTPDLSALIQQVVSRSGWATNNSLVIVIDGTGHRTARAFDDLTNTGPVLHVEYQ